VHQSAHYVIKSKQELTMTETVNAFFLAVFKLRQHLAKDATGTALMEDALNKLCLHYNSDPVARGGRVIIQNALNSHPHIHLTETRVAKWGFQVAVSCDNCGQQESHQVVNSGVDIATAIMVGKHEACKPKPRIVVPEPSTNHVVN
jgi:hypothetical protein